MSSDSIRPSSLAAVTGTSTLGEDAKKRANALRGMISNGAQSTNTDNFTIIPRNKLKTFKDHPFKVKDDQKMYELAESIKVYGVLSPILVRPSDDNMYEILAGHRRDRGSELAGLPDIPAKILNVDDDEAVIIMTATNLTNREDILPSEKAYAYKMQLEAFKRQGQRTDLTSLELVGWDAAQMVAETNSENKRNIARYIRLTYLIPDLLEMVDEGDIGFTAGVEISFLNEHEQNLILESITSGIIKKISLQNAEELKALSKDNQINETVIKKVFRYEDLSQQKLETYKVFQSATKRALKHFNKTDYQGVQINQDELEQILVDAIKNYADKKIEMQ